MVVDERAVRLEMRWSKRKAAARPGRFLFRCLSRWLMFAGRENIYVQRRLPPGGRACVCAEACPMEKGIYRTRIRGGLMKVRLTPPGDTQGVWLTAGRSAAGAVLIAVTVSACTGGGSSVPTIFTPSVQTPPSSQTHAGTRTPSPTGQGSRPPGTPAHTATTGH